MKRIILILLFCSLLSTYGCTADQLQEHRQPTDEEQIRNSADVDTSNYTATIIDTLSFAEITLNITDLPVYSVNWHYGEFEAPIAVPSSHFSLSPIDEYALPTHSEISPDGSKYAMLYKQSDEELVESAGEAGGINYRVVVHFEDGSAKEVYSFYCDYNEFMYSKSSVRWVGNDLLLINNALLYDLQDEKLYPLSYPDQDFLQRIEKTDYHMFTSIYEEDMLVIQDGAYLLAFTPYQNMHRKLFLYNVGTETWSEIVYDEEYSSYQEEYPDIEKEWAERRITAYYEDGAICFCVASLNDNSDYGDIHIYEYSIDEGTVSLLGNHLLDNAYLHSYQGGKYILTLKDKSETLYEVIDYSTGENTVLLVDERQSLSWYSDNPNKLFAINYDGTEYRIYDIEAETAYLFLSDETDYAWFDSVSGLFICGRPPQAYVPVF